MSTSTFAGGASSFSGNARTMRQSFATSASDCATLKNAVVA
jgi:hypothetical protein